MIKLHRVLMAGALLALVSVPAQASDIMGGLSLTGVSTSQNGADLSVSTLISSADTIAASTGSGDLSGTPLLTSFGANSVDTTLAASGFGFSISNATYGSFTGTGGSIMAQSSTLLDIYILGTLTPGTNAPAGVIAGPASIRLTINLNGSTLSESISLNAPPVSIPEPTSIAMAGIGLVAAGLVGLRKRSV